MFLISTDRRWFPLVWWLYLQLKHWNDIIACTQSNGLCCHAEECDRSGILLHCFPVLPAAPLHLSRRVWVKERDTECTLPAIRAIWFTQAGHVPRSTSTVVPGKRGWVGVRIDWVDRNVVPGPTKHLSPGICPVLINQAVRKALLGLDWAFSEKWPDEYCIAQRYYFITLRVLKYNICLRCFSIINFSFIIRENESILEWDKCWH